MSNPEIPANSEDEVNNDPLQEENPFRYQERNVFEDFLEDGTYRDPTPEEQEEIEKSLNKLAELFNGMETNWQLDGAINISALNKGEFIRVHKDIDISIESADLEKIDSHLAERGYGLFLSYRKNPDDRESPMVMERVHADDLRKTDEHPMIAAIDSRGKIVEGETLQFVDTHIIKRDEDGDPVGLGGVKLPEKWFRPRVEYTAKGPLHLAHPAKVAFFKLHNSRHYDMTDLEKLAELDALTPEDVADIRTAFTSENEALLSNREKLIDEVFTGLSPTTDENGIVEAFMAHPAIAEKGDGARPTIQKIASAIIASGKITPESAKKVTRSILDEPLDVEKVDILERLVEDVRKKKGLEKDLSK